MKVKNTSKVYILNPKLLWFCPKLWFCWPKFGLSSPTCIIFIPVGSGLHFSVKKPRISYISKNLNSVLNNSAVVDLKLGFCWSKDSPSCIGLTGSKQWCCLSGMRQFCCTSREWSTSQKEVEDKTKQNSKRCWKSCHHMTHLFSGGSGKDTSHCQCPGLETQSSAEGWARGGTAHSLTLLFYPQAQLSKGNLCFALFLLFQWPIKVW